jgi:hypothetical protein
MSSRLAFACLAFALPVSLAACGGNHQGQNLGSGFALSWNLVDVAAPDPTTAPRLSCAQANVATVLLDANQVCSGSACARYRTEFTCGTMEGVTPQYPESQYQIFLSALASDGTPRSQISFAADNYSDYDADLGLTIFTVKQ